MAFIVAVFLTFTFKFKVVVDDDEANIDLFFTKIFNIRLDVDELIKRFTQSKHREGGFSFYETFENIKKVFESRSFIKDILSYVVIKEIQIVDKLKVQDSFYKQFVDVFNWTTLSFVQRYLRENVKEVHKEEYIVLENFRENVARVNIYCIGEIKLVNIIMSILKNIREIPTIIKRFI
ncbi:hypothetical protein KHQ82_10050 [Mycoplasmatota bacterium]|nr:hypothetical protein KHQ82_10050 [Mycoplasmatota bacterium]